MDEISSQMYFSAVGWSERGSVETKIPSHLSNLQCTNEVFQKKKNAPPVSYHIFKSILSQFSRLKLNLFLMWWIQWFFPVWRTPPTKYCSKVPICYTVYYQQHLNPFNSSWVSSCTHLSLFISLFIHLSTVYTEFLLTLHLHLPPCRALREQRPRSPQRPRSHSQDE